MCDEKAKITNHNQFLNPKKKKIQKRVHDKHIRTPGYTRGEIRWLGEVCIPC